MEIYCTADNRPLYSVPVPLLDNVQLSCKKHSLSSKAKVRLVKPFFNLRVLHKNGYIKYRMPTKQLQDPNPNRDESPIRVIVNTNPGLAKDLQSPRTGPIYSSSPYYHISF